MATLSTEKPILKGTTTQPDHILHEAEEPELLLRTGAAQPGCTLAREAYKEMSVVQRSNWKQLGLINLAVFRSPSLCNTLNHWNAIWMLFSISELFLIPATAIPPNLRGIFCWLAQKKFSPSFHFLSWSKVMLYSYIHWGSALCFSSA